MWKMLRCLHLTVILMTATGHVHVNQITDDPVANILLEYKIREGGPTLLRTSAGAPLEYQYASSTLDTNLLRNVFFLDSLTHLHRERIPTRFVHAEGNGPFGYFEVTHDITRLCKAKLFSAIGKKTPVAVRFSLTTTKQGASDIRRDIRGFAIKFYTEEGNWDIVAVSSPTFPIKDPIFFTSFAHSNQQNPKNNLLDHNMRWDFFTRRPEGVISVLNLYSDRGTPDGYRHIPGFSVHTYQVENEDGDISFMRFHLIPNAGFKNLRREESERLAGTVPDYSARDLYNSIENGTFPSWTLAIQVLTLEDVKQAKFDPFDITKYLPEDEYPVVPVGQLILNKNPTNFFAQIEQIAVSPANLVPGILGAPDKIFEARMLSYIDAQNYRLGVNHNKIPVNCPLNIPRTYNRDGRPPVKDNEKDAPHYFPNSFYGPEPYLDKKRSKIIELIQDQPDYVSNIKQAREYYLHYLTADERRTLPGNIVSSLGRTVRFIQERALKLFYLIDHDLGNRIARGLETNSTTHYSQYH